MRTSLWLLAFALVFVFADAPYRPAAGLLLLAVFIPSLVLAVWGDVCELRMMRGGRA